MARLRYSLGGDRPSQTTHQTMSLTRIHGSRLESQINQGGISKDDSREAGASLSKSPTYPTQIHPEFIVKL